MIFWSIKLLKQRLIDGGLSQKHLFAYIFTFIMFGETIGLSMFYMSFEGFNRYDHAASMAHFITVSLGTCFIYWANGGSEGEKFAERFFSISIVVGMRFFFLLVPTLIILIIGQNQLENSEVSTSLYDAIILPALLVTYYWRVMVQVRDVANSSPD